MIPTLLLDCDGILTDYAAQTAALLNELQLDKIWLPEEITNWEASTFVPPDKKKQYWAACKAPGFVSRMQPYPEAQKAVAKLRGLADVVVVTSYLKGAETWVHERDQWLKQHFDIPPERVIHTRAKQHVFGHVFVDDALKNVVPWAAAHRVRGCRALLWDKPYNVDTPNRPHYRRISNWESVFEAVCDAMVIE